MWFSTVGRRPAAESVAAQFFAMRNMTWLARKAADVEPRFRGGAGRPKEPVMSFHSHYTGWNAMTNPDGCPVCRNEPMPEGTIDLAELSHSWLNSNPVECMKGACHATSKYHGIELFDLNASQLCNLMKDVSLYAKALKKVTRAVKINYEIHGNTVPHLHVHLYPRQMDDPFPEQPIDYRRKTKSIYAPGEYDAFVAEMRMEISRPSKTEPPDGS